MILNRAKLVALATSLRGLPIYGCLPGSPADRAGIRFGDVLLEIDGHPTQTWGDYIEARSSSDATITLRLFRDGAELIVELVLDLARAMEPAALVEALGFLGGRAEDA